MARTTLIHPSRYNIHSSFYVQAPLSPHQRCDSPNMANIIYTPTYYSDDSEDEISTVYEDHVVPESSSPASSSPYAVTPTDDGGLNSSTTSSSSDLKAAGYGAGELTVKRTAHSLALLASDSETSPSVELVASPRRVVHPFRPSLSLGTPSDVSGTYDASRSESMTEDSYDSPSFRFSMLDTPRSQVAFGARLFELLVRVQEERDAKVPENRDSASITNEESLPPPVFAEPLTLVLQTPCLSRPPAESLTADTRISTRPLTSEGRANNTNAASTYARSDDRSNSATICALGPMRTNESNLRKPNSRLQTPVHGEQSLNAPPAPRKNTYHLLYPEDAYNVEVNGSGTPIPTSRDKQHAYSPSTATSSLSVKESVLPNAYSAQPVGSCSPEDRHISKKVKVDQSRAENPIDPDREDIDLRAAPLLPLNRFAPRRASLRKAASLRNELTLQDEFSMSQVERIPCNVNQN
ncbi:hypothetical protein K474DRAFT_255306 [Panus rudis PR-1116 ss-1]|nr:hypothetical protein K474DRAFT_255306 [Panus rudis PR-1116 ss-1]